MLAKEVRTVFYEMNFGEFLLFILIVVCGFVPVLNTIMGYRAYNDWRKN